MGNGVGRRRRVSGLSSPLSRQWSERTVIALVMQHDADLEDGGDNVVEHGIGGARRHRAHVGPLRDGVNDSRNVGWR